MTAHTDTCNLSCDGTCLDTGTTHCYPAMTIDHGRIPSADREIALANAQRDPDGRVFPWLPGYPLVGSTVYAIGTLWTVAKRERGAGQDRPTAIVQLVGQGHDDTAALTIGECRPVTWTQAQEDGDEPS